MVLPDKVRVDNEAPIILIPHCGRCSDVLERGISFERILALYDRNLSGSYGFVQDPGPTGLLNLALVTYNLGYPDLALKRAAEGLQLARELSHPYTLAWVLNHATILRVERGEEREASALCEENFAICSKHGFDELLADAMVWQGWEMVKRGLAVKAIERIREALVMGNISHEVGPLIALATAHCSLGQAEEGLMVITEALTKESESERRNLLPWLYRLKGELLLIQFDQTEVEAERYFRQSIETARKQRSKSQELKSSTRLARLLVRQKRHTEARAMLSEIYKWFTEGFDTADLKEAKALLEELRS